MRPRRATPRGDNIKNDATNPNRTGRHPGSVKPCQGAEALITILTGGTSGIYYPVGTALSYDGQPADVPTASVPNFLVTCEGVGDDVAHLMTKSLFDHLDQLVQRYPAAKDIDVKKAATRLPIPLHPDAGTLLSRNWHGQIAERECRRA